MCMCKYIYIYIYIYTQNYAIYIYIYMYIYLFRVLLRRRRPVRGRRQVELEARRASRQPEHDDVLIVYKNTLYIDTSIHIQEMSMHLNDDVYIYIYIHDDVLSTMKETQTQRPFILDSKHICETHCPLALVFSYDLFVWVSWTRSGSTTASSESRRAWPRSCTPRAGRCSRTPTM